MDLWQLNIFCKVIELKSFSKAGEVIHLSQPTVSSHIKDLEEHFDCKLIDRLGKEALPTKSGQLLYRYAKKMLSLRDETETALAQFKGKTKGHLVIGGSTIPGGYILPQAISAFIGKYPEVTIDLEISDTDKILKDILEGTIELGVVGARSTHKHIWQEPLIEDRMCLIVRNDHKWSKRKAITPDMLINEPFIAREQGSGTFKSLKDCLSANGFDPSTLSIIATMGNTAAVCQAVKSGLGISVLSPRAVKDELKQRTLTALDIEGVDLSRHFYLTRHKNRSQSPLCETFQDFLKPCLKKL